MVGGLSKLAIALIVVFALSLTGLFAELLYVLWRRRRFLQQCVADGYPEVPKDPPSIPSKELIYFICLKNQTPNEPDEAPREINGAREACGELTPQKLYGSSRAVLGVEEDEERDSLGSASERCSPAEEEKSVCLSFHPLTEVPLEVEEENDTTPFGTPCAPTPYYTPWPSPTREVEGDLLNSKRSLGNGRTVQELKESPADCLALEVTGAFTANAGQRQQSVFAT